jgi:carbamoyl-phosphate synthase small subunit
VRANPGAFPLPPSLVPSLPPALLALADGTLFHGTSVGAPGHTVGEVVFNTALTGYQEILTDPSYCRQIVTLTYPHIGNVGINAEDVEASRVHAAGLIVTSRCASRTSAPQ